MCVAISGVDPGLRDAISVLESQAANVIPNHVQILSGALALRALCRLGSADLDLIAAAEELEALALGVKPPLTLERRMHATKLAARVRLAIADS